jgi:phosphatidylserine decarboxylase
MKKSELTVGLLKRLPKNTISRAFGIISDVEFPAPMQQVVNRTFVHFSGIDPGEAEKPLEDYESLNAFFTRRLREGARSVEVSKSEALVSPVDGTMGALGTVEEGTLFQAKGRDYRLLDLVDSAEEERRFQGGSYATIYLSPRDYHRIHSPAQGTVDKISYIPGHLFPVNPFAVENIDQLFAVNERLITFLETSQLGRVAVIKVGATCVGRISLSFAALSTNGGFRRRREFRPEQLFEFSHGDELAVFNLGSTVIVLVENDQFRFRKGVGSGDVLQMGEMLGGI